MADSRLFLYGALAILSFLVWQTWQLEQAPPAALTEVASGADDSVPTQLPSLEIPAADVPEARTLVAPRADVPKRLASAPSDWITVRTDVLNLRIDPVGGSVMQADLPAYPISLDTPDQPTRLLFADEQTYMVQSGLTHDRKSDRHRAPSHHARYQTQQRHYDFTEASDSKDMTLVWHSDDGVQVVKRYRFTPGSYRIEVSHEVKNGSRTEWIGRQYRQLRRSAGPEQERTSILFGNTSAISFRGAAYHDSETYHKLSFDDIQDAAFSETIDNGWVAMLQHYFVTAWVPQRDEPNHYYTRTVQRDRYPEYIIGMHSPARRVAVGEQTRFMSELYLGPKEQRVLAEIADGLDLTVDYGVLTFLAKPLFWVLDKIYALFGNWGVAIILLTVLIKLVFYKLSETSYRSMAKMRKFTPRIQQLRDRYAGDRAKMNEAMMKMYREEKVNPLGGCWPILVQVPVFIALYWVLLESVELRQAPFIAWIYDLSVRDPYYVLPLLMGASMVIQTRLNPTPPDPIQAKLMMALPVVFTVFFLFFPAGLVLYWLVNNILAISQQWFIIKRMNA